MLYRIFIFGLFFCSILIANEHRAFISPVAMYRKYSEEVDRGKSDELGWLYGIQLGYDLIRSQYFYFGSDLTTFWGDSRYRGSLKNLQTKEVCSFHSVTQNFLIDWESRIGYTYYANGYKIVPHLIFGYYYWDREASNTSVGYDEIYSWLYYGLGGQFYCRTSPRCKFGFRVKVLYMQNANITVRKLFAFPVAAKLGNRLQYEVQIPIVYRITNQIDMSLVINGAYRQIGASQKQRVGSYTFHEPGSTVQELGFQLQIGYLFD